MSNYSYIESAASLPDDSQVDPQVPVCETNLIHEDRVRAATAALINNEAAAGLADVFQALADPTRLKIVSALLTSELCVCDLSAVLGMTQSAISHQLRLLRALGVVKNRKEGRIVYYALDDDHIRDLFERGLAHYQHRNQS
jgi:ArsR family transcriptional regulator, lead/cadmium/zinc/bismuth-responsive transcriptional repressor